MLIELANSTWEAGCVGASIFIYRARRAWEALRRFLWYKSLCLVRCERTDGTVFARCPGISVGVRRAGYAVATLGWR